jgi:hypothetical protein
MSRIAPDLPELERVPYAARSIVYMQAFTRALWSPATWGAGALLFAVAVGLGANQGSAALGFSGALLGTIAGGVAAGWAFFKVLLPWRTRRLLPSVIDETKDAVGDHVRQFEERTRRMADAQGRREAPRTDDDSRHPERLP